MSSRAPGRVWPGVPGEGGALGSTGLRVWLTQEGYALSRRLPDGTLAILASTGESPDLADVPAGTRSRTVQGDGLDAVVPAGFSILLDAGAPGRRLLPAAEVDRLRAPGPPDGSEVDLDCDEVPAHLRPLAQEAIAAAKQAGAKRAVAVYAKGGGREGLWLSLHRASEAAHGAAFAVVERHATRTSVRILDVDDLDDRARTVLYAGIGREAARDAPDVQPFSTRQNLVVLVVCLIGAGLVVAGRGTGGTAGTALEVFGWALEALLLVGVISAASGQGMHVPGLPSRASGRPFRPIPFLAFLAVSALLVWQAVKGLR